MSDELVYSGDWEIEETEGEPPHLTGSCTCPECGEWVGFGRTFYDSDDALPESGDTYDVECDECGCEFVVQLT